MQIVLSGVSQTYRNRPKEFLHLYGRTLFLWSDPCLGKIVAEATPRPLPCHQQKLKADNPDEKKGADIRYQRQKKSDPDREIPDGGLKKTAGSLVPPSNHQSRKAFSKALPAGKTITNQQVCQSRQLAKKRAMKKHADFREGKSGQEIHELRQDPVEEKRGSIGNFREPHCRLFRESRSSYVNFRTVSGQWKNYTEPGKNAMENRRWEKEGARVNPHLS